MEPGGVGSLLWKGICTDRAKTTGVTRQFMFTYESAVAHE